MENKKTTELDEAIKHMRSTISTFDRNVYDDNLPYNPDARHALLVIRAAENWRRIVEFVEYKRRPK